MYMILDDLCVHSAHNYVSLLDWSEVQTRMQPQ